MAKVEITKAKFQQAQEQRNVFFHTFVANFKLFKIMQEIELWSLVPFILMLLSIAIMPLIAGKWWESNFHKLCVALGLALPTSIYLIANGMGENLTHQMAFDYLPFITLLCALFVVTGGIYTHGSMQARPLNNTIVLAIGFVLASFIGTTGAAMLMIRPLIDMNQQRKHVTHTILFFIALVANCGGVLTPLGDPPLFLLYLRGVDFFWFLNLLPQWLFTGITLLAIYYAFDTYTYYKREPIEAVMADVREKERLKINGKINIVYLLAIVLTVSFVNSSYIPRMGAYDAPITLRFLREFILIGIILLSLLTTKKRVRKENNFSWEPIVEVGVVFIGIFATMTPALLYLNANAAKLGITEPWQFYYGAGLLSAFLDNSPTAVAFHTVAQGLPHSAYIDLVAGVPEQLLKAISLGAVFFGAMTYIGNGPNFMVKAIAEQNGIKMPDFFGYIIQFSLVVLLPVYILVQVIFL